MSNYKKMNINYLNQNNNATLCKGGYYMWQNDSKRSRYCKKLASSEKGRKLITDNECCTMYTGASDVKFHFTPLYDSNWENRQCDGVL